VCSSDLEIIIEHITGKNIYDVLNEYEKGE